MPVNKWFDKGLMMKADRAMRWVEKSGATAIAADAQRNVHDNTGNLASRISPRKSKYANGGWIAFSGAPHSTLVEYGHDIKARGPRREGKKVKFYGHKLDRPNRSSTESGRVKAYPFMKPAVGKNKPPIELAFRAIYRNDK